MADNEHTQNEQSSDFQDGTFEEPQAAPGQDFYDHEVERYLSALESDRGEAMKRYGFTLFHSLPFERQVELARELGIEPRDAVDYFNLASVSIQKEQYSEAVKLLQQALKADGQFSDAAYNLALCHERLGNKSEATKQWNRFLDLTQDDAARQQVQVHLSEAAS